MRGRAISVLLFSFFSFVFGSTAGGDCTLGLAWSGQFRTTAYDLSVDGNDIWVATGYGLQLFDRSDDPPSLAAAGAVAGLAKFVRARNGIAYAGSGSTLAVARRNGQKIDVVRTIDAGGDVQALFVDATGLYVGTTNGLSRYDLFDPLNPAKANASFTTSSSSITSLSGNGSTLYVTDGDSSVEIFSVAAGFPQKTGTVDALPRSVSAWAAGNYLYVSDGTQTDIFLLGSGTPAKVASVLTGSTALATLTGNVQFVAGQGRSLTAIDFTTPGAPIRLYATEIPTSGGSVNRINAISSVAGRVYVAAGDSGLLTYDTSRFTAPFPMRSYSLGYAGSVAISDTSIVGGGDGFLELQRGSGTSMTVGRSWNAGTSPTVHEITGDGFLVSSVAKTLTYSTLKSTTPAAVTTVTFRANVKVATVSGPNAYALLDDGSFWSASLQQTSPVPTQIALPAAASSMARSGSSFAFVQVKADGTTDVTFYPTTDFAATPVRVNVPGAATTTVALSGRTAAVFTFRGVNVIDFTGSGSVSALPGSNSQIATNLAIAGGRVLELTASELIVWNLTTKAVESRFALPASPTSLAADASLAAIGTADGIAAIAYTGATRLPEQFASGTGNAYYRKALASGTRLGLLATGRVDLYDTAVTRALRYAGAINAPGVIDAAGSATGFFTLNAFGVVTAWSRDGQSLASTTIAEGSDSVPLAIHALDGAVFVSISKGCLTGGCEKKTFVLDPKTLATTSTMTGAIVDLVQQGTRAFVSTDLPAELRALNVADPLHPAVIATKPLQGSSLTLAGSTLYALGDRLYSYSTTDLTPLTTQLDASTATPLVRSAGTCSIVSRGGAAQLYDAANAAAWTSKGTLALPAGVRSMTVVGDALAILTDYSVELYTAAGASVKPSRRRP